MAEYMPWLVEDLLKILTDAAVQTAAGTIPREWAEAFYVWRVVGIPKRGSDDSRPIGVASILTRAWHSLFFKELPDPAPEQWSEKGVVRATAHWASTEGSDGAELDLAKAYDSIPHDAAAEALRWHGVPEEVVASLVLS